MWQMFCQQNCQLAELLVLLQATFMPKTANGKFGITFVSKESVGETSRKVIKQKK
ncbi:MAG: hypothetical protein IJZ05_07350 [Rikenellaceae bacterium]|nr:hypothetical protein [Rikenellaceae bacterium]